MGGSMHVHHIKEHPFLVAEKKLIRRIVHEGGPVWGICLGAQLLAEAAGGDAFKRKKPEVGWTSIEKVADDPLLHGISSPFMAFNWHEYSCKLPPTSHLVARCGEGVQVFRAGGNAWGTQFHPEVDDELAPHWVRDAAHGAPRAGQGAGPSSCRPTPTSTCRTTRSSATSSPRTSSSPPVCSRRTDPGPTGLVNARRRRRSAAGAHPFPGSPSGRGACERSHGVVPGGTLHGGGMCGGGLHRAVRILPLPPQLKLPPRVLHM